MRRRGFKDKTIKEIQETFFRFGIYAEPKVTKPTELEDYNFIPFSSMENINNPLIT
ncbi:MAG TPA: hypothetical protein VMW81_07685 [Nitrospinota bacterium]|nr:hypothetical protein [Nitrospinota bacterium]